MTVGVYGLVAGIVKLDDLGLYLTRRASALAKGVGALLLRAAPWLMKFLSVAGTAAMFLVGGGILSHGVGPLHHLIEGLTQGLGSPMAALGAALLDALVGIVAGALVLSAVALVARLRGKAPGH
jgi:predicted DNA repair protein MutK